MKLKNIVIIIVAVAVLAVGYDSISNGNSSSNLENSIISTLPEEITTCYCINDDNEKVLNTLEVKEFTINRQTTEGNYKSADCTIDMEGNDIKKTVYVNLGCVKYDDGSWQVDSWRELSDPNIIPKYQPDESLFISEIKKIEGYKSLSKINEYVDLENGDVVYFYNVLDTYDYCYFSGDGVSCSANFRSFGEDNYGIDIYRWELITENNTEIVWDVLGTWHLEYSFTGQPPYRTADITLNALVEENGGTSTYSYPCHDGYEYTGEFKTFEGGASCSLSGTNPLDAKCVIRGYKSSVTITCEGVRGYIHNLEQADCQTVIRK